MSGVAGRQVYNEERDDLAQEGGNGFLAVRLGGRLMVPACWDCEESGKCARFGCAHAAMAKAGLYVRAPKPEENG